jgi:hypothetical protein
LLSVAYGFAVPANALKHFAWAEKEFDQDDLAKSAMHVALTGLPRLAADAPAHRLHIAAGILGHGFLTPMGLMKVCELDPQALESLAKYDPYQPRVPAGNPDGGQWTSTDNAIGPSSRGNGDAATSEGSLEVAVLTRNFGYACRALGLDPNEASKILH